MSKFIQIIGTSGSGKSSAHDEINGYLTNQGYEVVSFIEPDPLRDLIKRYHYRDDMDPLVEASWFAADRMMTFEKKVFPRKDEKNLVFTADRGLPDSLVYQGIIGGLGVEYILRLNKFIPPADLCLCLVVDGIEGHRRAMNRFHGGGDPVSKSEQPDAIDARVRAYHEIAPLLPNYHIIDTTRMRPEEVLDMSLGYVKGLLE